MKDEDEEDDEDRCAMSMTEPDARALELRDVSGVGRDGEAVRAISARFEAGRFHVLCGPQGGGCEVLLRLLGLLQAPATGEVLVHGHPTRALREEARVELRTQRFGFVFTAPFLLSSFSVVENVAMPLFKVSQVTSEEARRRTEKLLAFVGLREAAEAPAQGLAPLAEYRVALARGLINEPSFLLVEQLDGVLAGEELHAFIRLLDRVTRELGTTVIATSSPALPRLGPQRVLAIADGAIASDTEVLPEVEA